MFDLRSKDRRCVFDAQAIDVLPGIFADVCSDAHAMLVEIDGEDDAVHLPISYLPERLFRGVIRDSGCNQMTRCINGVSASAISVTGKQFSIS